MKTNFKPIWTEIANLETRRLFCPQEPAFPSISSFHWWAHPCQPCFQPCPREGIRGSGPLPDQTWTSAAPFPRLLRAVESIHSGRFVYSVNRFCLQLADQERGEEGITSDGWSGELMKGRLRGFANGASGRKICGWISTRGCSYYTKNQNCIF